MCSQSGKVHVEVAEFVWVYVCNARIVTLLEVFRMVQINPLEPDIRYRQCAMQC